MCIRDRLQGAGEHKKRQLHTGTYAVGVFYVLQRLEAVIIASQIFFDFAVYIMFFLIAQPTFDFLSVYPL